MKKLIILTILLASCGGEDIESNQYATGFVDQNRYGYYEPDPPRKIRPRDPLVFLPPVTFTDETTNLTWERTPEWGTFNQQEAQFHCSFLNAEGHFDGHTNWRLPTISELRSMVRGCVNTQTHGACGVTDTCAVSSCRNTPCGGCGTGLGPANGCYWEANGECDLSSWSSTRIPGMSTKGWMLNFSNGAVVYGLLTAEHSVRCVREN